MDQWPADILIYALVAAGLVLWLRNILGTRHGEERQRPNPFDPANQKQEDTSSGRDDDEAASETNVIPMPGMPPVPQGKNKHRDYAEDAAQPGLVQIALADRNFEAADFIDKAQDAFSMIITAFAEGDSSTLRDLLNDSTYKAFDNAIREREKKGETVTTEVHAIRDVRILEADLHKKRHATLTLRFTADETCVVRDKDDTILSGHPDQVTEMVDVWVFGRDVKSSDPRWFLIETRDDVVEEHDAKTPIPETDKEG